MAKKTTKQKPVTVQSATDTTIIPPPPKCPTGKYWNGSECVLDAG